METRQVYDATTGQVLATVSFPAGTPEAQWKLAMNGYNGQSNGSDAMQEVSGNTVVQLKAATPAVNALGQVSQTGSATVIASSNL